MSLFLFESLNFYNAQLEVDKNNKEIKNIIFEFFIKNFELLIQNKPNNPFYDYLSQNWSKIQVTITRKI